MPSCYLSGGDYAAFGLPDDTTTTQVVSASNLVNTYLRRPEGVVWSPDFNGVPAYMAGLAPSWKGALPLGLAPGVGQVIPFVQARSQDLVGEVLVVDAGTQTCEAVTVTGCDRAKGLITLGLVQVAHAPGATMALGLTIAEDRSLPSRRSLTRVSRPNFAQMVGCSGRYGYGRRSNDNRGFGLDFSLLAASQAFSPVPFWENIDITNVSVSATSGEVWIPSGLLLAYFSEVRMRYVAGFPAWAIPTAIKQATANLVQNGVSSDNDLGPQIKLFQAGGTRLERFSDSNFDSDTKAMLEPYRTRVMA